MEDFACNHFCERLAKSFESSIIKEYPYFRDFTLWFINIFYYLANNRNHAFPRTSSFIFVLF